MYINRNARINAIYSFFKVQLINRVFTRFLSWYKFIDTWRDPVRLPRAICFNMQVHELH